MQTAQAYDAHNSRAGLTPTTPPLLQIVHHPVIFCRIEDSIVQAGGIERLGAYALPSQLLSSSKVTVAAAAAVNLVNMEARSSVRTQAG